MNQPCPTLFLVSVLTVFSILSCSVDHKTTVTSSKLRIVGGEAVPADHYIAKTAISIRSKYTGRTFCSGTLIAPKLVLTAAHCVQKLDMDSVVGIGLISSQSDELEIADSRIHPDYDESQLEQDHPTAGANDIGLILLNTAAPDSMLPVTLRSEKLTLQEGDEITLVGYGVSQLKPTTESGTLRFVTTNIEKISSDYKEFSYGGNPGKSACIGDSGGPAFLNVDGSYALVGVISKGEALCTQSGINTDVRKFTDWIAGTAFDLARFN